MSTRFFRLGAMIAAWAIFTLAIGIPTCALVAQLAQQGPPETGLKIGRAHV